MVETTILNTRFIVNLSSEEARELMSILSIIFAGKREIYFRSDHREFGRKNIYVQQDKIVADFHLGYTAGFVRKFVENYFADTTRKGLK